MTSSSLIKAIVYMMASSGIRKEAWDELKMKHITPETSGNITCRRMLIYPGHREEYYTFITLEAYNALKGWIDYRASNGGKQKKIAIKYMSK
jgi:hypothetical protein